MGFVRIIDDDERYEVPVSGSIFIIRRGGCHVAESLGIEDLAWEDYCEVKSYPGLPIERSREMLAALREAYRLAAPTPDSEPTP